MSALVPASAVCLLYRRYLKAANNVTNITMRMMLLQQVRTSFRRHSNVRTAAAQRELIVQAHKDLNILEDNRLQRSLYINRLGMVSCVDWETRQTEFHLDPKATPTLLFIMVMLFLCLNMLPFFAWLPEDRHPEQAAIVDAMANRVHGLETEADVEREELRRVQGMLATSKRQRELQHSILSTFDDSPYATAPKTNYRAASPHAI